MQIEAGKTTYLNHKMISNSELDIVEIVKIMPLTAGGSENSMVEETKKEIKLGL